MSRCDHAFACGVCHEANQRLAREWRDSILRHEEKRDDEARLRDGLERRAEKAEAAVMRLRAIVDLAHELERANDAALGALRPRPDIAWRNLKVALAGDRTTSAKNGGDT